MRNPSAETKLDDRESMEDLPLCGLSPTKWGREGLVGCGLSPTVLVGVGLGGREREARMGESLGRRGKEEDGGEMRERKN
jgi:hypothetical protein